jgi:serine/threonine protein phosphatase PrpC
VGLKKEMRMLDPLSGLWARLTGRSGDRAARSSAKQTEAGEPPEAAPYDMQQLLAAVGQSAGKQRQHNEDSVLAITATLTGIQEDVPFGLYIVADGMGGHEYGEVASSGTVRIVADQILQSFHPYLFGVPTQQPGNSPDKIMQEAIAEAHRKVQRDAPGSGTTVTAALVLGREITIGHVGDSRAYGVDRAGGLQQLTQDHSLVRRLEELGHLNQEEAANYPHRNVLIRAVGQGETIEADIFTVPFPDGGTLMLCTDGLWGVLPEDAIRRSLAETANLQRACNDLVQQANAAGGPDNISVILVQRVG